MNSEFCSYPRHAWAHARAGAALIIVVGCSPTINEPQDSVGPVLSVVAKAGQAQLRGNDDLAIEYCSHALELDPNYVLAYETRALSQSRKGNLDGAIADYSHAIRLKPEDAGLYYARAYAYRAKGLVKEANSDEKTGKHLNKIDRLKQAENPQYPHEHPAAFEVSEKIFLKLDVRSEEDYLALSRRDRYVWDVQWFEKEVTNGGIDQFFYNSVGDHTAETLEALEAIGAKQAHAWLRRGADLFPNKRPSPDREIRQEQLDALRGEDQVLDDLIEGTIEIDLYQRLLDYWNRSDPGESQ